MNKFIFFFLYSLNTFASDATTASLHHLDLDLYQQLQADAQAITQSLAICAPQTHIRESYTHPPRACLATDGISIQVKIEKLHADVSNLLRTGELLVLKDEARGSIAATPLFGQILLEAIALTLPYSNNCNFSISQSGASISCTNPYIDALNTMHAEVISHSFNRYLERDPSVLTKQDSVNFYSANKEIIVDENLLRYVRNLFALEQIIDSKSAKGLSPLQGENFLFLSAYQINPVFGRTHDISANWSAELKKMLLAKVEGVEILGTNERDLRNIVNGYRTNGEQYKLLKDRAELCNGVRDQSRTLIICQ